MLARADISCISSEVFRVRLLCSVHRGVGYTNVSTCRCVCDMCSLALIRSAVPSWERSFTPALSVCVTFPTQWIGTGVDLPGEPGFSWSALRRPVTRGHSLPSCGDSERCSLSGVSRRTACIRGGMAACTARGCCDQGRSQGSTLSTRWPPTPRVLTTTPALRLEGAVVEEPPAALPQVGGGAAGDLESRIG